MAYATLAGLPAVAGLYCYLVAGVPYALFGSARRVAVGPTSSLALLMASSLLPLAGGDARRYALLAAATASLVGLACLAARVVRAGVIVNFVSTVVTTGFTAGAALLIISTQLPKLLGVADGTGNFFARVGALAAHLPETHWPSLLLGGSALAVLAFLAWRWAGRPTTIAVVAIVLAAMHFTPLAQLGIRTAGRVPQGVPHPSLALLALPPSDLGGLLGIAGACALLAYVETIAAGRAVGDERGEPTDPEAELVGLGAANLVTGTFSGFPVSGGISQSAVNDLSGARSRLSLVVTSAAVALVLLFVAGLLSAIPEPLLGAIVVVAAARLVRVDELVRIWRGARHEFWIAVFAAFAVLALGLLGGVLSAVAVSLFMVVARASRPEIAVLGELPGTTRYVNVEFNPEAVAPAGVLALRTFGPWYYFNAGFIKERVLELVATASPPPQLVVIDFSASPTLDLQSASTLKSIDDALAARGIRLVLARLYDETADKLRRTHALRTPFERHQSVHDLVERYRPRT
jgi:high affinity sulfate transporter 1